MMIRTVLRNRISVDLWRKHNFKFHTAITGNREQVISTNLRKYGSGVGLQSFVELAEAKKTLKSVYQSVHDEILEDQLVFHKDLPKLKERYSKLIDYYLSVDTKYTLNAVMVVYAYKQLEKASNLTEENLRRAAVLGWCYKLLEVAVTIYDDIDDKTSFRFGKPTWVKLVGDTEAMFDAAFITSSVHFLLMNHFSSHPQYLNIHKELTKISACCSISVMLDGRPHPFSEVEMHENSMKILTYVVPMLQAILYMANIDDPKVHSATAEVAADLSRFLKIMDDVRATFGPSSDIHKEGTDITLGRPTWTALQVAKLGTPAQKKIMEEHYGNKNESSVPIVIDLYKEMKLNEIYEDYKKSFYEETKNKIMKLPKELPTNLFLTFLDVSIMEKII